MSRIVDADIPYRAAVSACVSRPLSDHISATWLRVILPLLPQGLRECVPCPRLSNAFCVGVFHERGRGSTHPSFPLPHEWAASFIGEGGGPLASSHMSLCAYNFFQR